MNRQPHPKITYVIIVALAHQPPGLITLGGVLEFFAILAGLVTVTGVVAGSWRVARHTQVVADQAALINTQKERIDEQNGRIEALQQEGEQDKQMIRDLQGRVSVLQDLATGKSAIEAMAETITQIAETLSTIQARMDSMAGKPPG